MHRLPAFQSILLRACGEAVCGSGPRASLLVLTFHRVLTRRDPLLPSEPDVAAFSALMDLVATTFRVLPLTDAVRSLRYGSLPKRSLCITFDDGYANNFENALPILAARGIPATIFVASGFLNGGLMFNDRIIEAIRGAPTDLDLQDEGLGVYRLIDDAHRRAAINRIIDSLKYLPPTERQRRTERIADTIGRPLPSNLMMTPAQVAYAHGMGFEIGAHTVTHPILAQVPEEVAKLELLECKRALADITGSPITSFAYPNGRPGRDYTDRHVSLAREAGYSIAVSTAWGAATTRSDVMQIPRVAPWEKTTFAYALRVVRSYRQTSTSALSSAVHS